MKDVHFRVSDRMHKRMQQEAESDGVRVAQFAREATIARTVMRAAEHGRRWARTFNRLIAEIRLRGTG